MAARLGLTGGAEAAMAVASGERRPGDQSCGPPALRALRALRAPSAGTSPFRRETPAQGAAPEVSAPRCDFANLSSLRPGRAPPLRLLSGYVNRRDGYNSRGDRDLPLKLTCHARDRFHTFLRAIQS